MPSLRWPGLTNRTLQETAEGFKVDSYGVVGWACHTIRTRMKLDKKFRDRVERIQDAVNQQKI